MKKAFALLLSLALLLGTAGALAQNQRVVIGATPVPHQLILEFIKDDLAALGFDLDILTFTDYVLPNPATSAGELDANYFQHVPYLNLYNANVPDSEKLVAAIPVHYEPYGIYAGTKDSLDQIAAGDHIAITNDPSNETRALLLLRDAGLITLADDVTWESSLTKLDVVDAKGIIIDEVNAELIPSTLEDVAFAVINGNFAIGAGLNPAEDALFLEPVDSESGVTYTNYVVVKAGRENEPFVEALRSVLYTQKVRDFILNHEDFKGGVIPTFPEPAQ
ncbi:MAG TPA: MetQ/NlpA family ABC transporter substrate-binding protein [Candidatus Limnocylindria bacterium]|nr:MetQ/NlpA family ABC transporter substrate-binding protein [Candidatus Limnocylindria bacterium]